MNIISHLHEYITPQVLTLLQNHAGDDANKKALLSSLYSIIAARLADPQISTKAQALSSHEQHDGTVLLDTLFKNDDDTSQLTTLTDELTKEFSLPTDTVKAATMTATPLAFGEFNRLADGKPLASFLQDNSTNFAEFLPSWAVALLPAGLLASLGGLTGSALSGIKGVVSSTTDAASNLASSATDSVSNAIDGATDLAGNAVSKVANVTQDATDAVKAGATTIIDGAKDLASSASTHVNDQLASTTSDNGNGFLKSLLPIIGLIILAGLAWLLLRGCQDTKTPVATPTTSGDASTATAPTTDMNTTPAMLSFATNETGDALYSCRATAGSESAFASIRTALSSVFGTSDKCTFITKEGFAGNIDADSHLASLVGLLKGTPNASMNINGKTIQFNATDEATISKLIEGAKGIVPTDFTVEAEPQIDAATVVSNSIDAAKSSLSTLTDSSAPTELIHALNLQIINFASASNDIPAENKAVLDIAAEKLANMPTAKLKITGHTDSQGNYNANKALSERRAAAVRDYLVSKGIPAEQLEIFGASSDEPVASNATAQGRFANRRIEFTLIEADGTVTTAGDATNSQAATSTQASDSK